MIKLYDYQQKLVNKARQAYADGYKAPCIVASCGSGKSVMIAEIVRLATVNKRKVLFLVHRKELIEQIETTLKQNSVDMEYVTLGMVMTVVRRLKSYPKFDLIVVDENHHVLASSYKKILNHFNTKVIGFTATPVRLNGDGLGDINDILIQEVDTKWLIKNKRLAPYDCYIPNLIDRSKLSVSSTHEFTTASISKELGNVIFGDVIKHYKELAYEQQTIVYCHSIEFSKQVSEQFNNNGIKSEHIDGETPKKQREQIIKDFRNKKITVLTNVDLIGEGFDVPDCSCVILLRPTQSLSLHIQQSMRAMRYQPDKIATIIDHVGNTLVHGLPDDDREWELNPPKKKRKNKISDTPYSIKACAECLYAYPSKLKCCPMCGYAPPVEQQTKKIDAKAELVKANRDTVKKQQLANKNWRSAKSYKELKAMAEAKGYKSSWAAFKAKELHLKDTPEWVYQYTSKKKKYRNISAVLNS